MWLPYTEVDRRKLEQIQRRGARFITNDYLSKTPGDMTKIISDLNLPTLQERRDSNRLKMFHKIASNTLPSMKPEDFLTPYRRNRRQIKPIADPIYETSNIVHNSASINPVSFKPLACRTNQRRNSFFPATIIAWNNQSELTVNNNSETIDTVGPDLA